SISFSHCLPLCIYFPSTAPSHIPLYTLSLHDALPIYSTNAPKFLIPVTFPITLLPTSTDILIYYPPNYHLLSLYNNTIKKKNNHYNIVTIILPELLFQHFHRSISAN